MLKAISLRPRSASRRSNRTSAFVCPALPAVRVPLRSAGAVPGMLIRRLVSVVVVPRGTRVVEVRLNILAGLLTAILG
jgi:hypothetical protein